MRNLFDFISLDPSRAMQRDRELQDALRAKLEGEMRARRQERQMTQPMWSSSAATPVPLPGWEAQDGDDWFPVVAVIINLRGELQVCIAPPDSKVGWLTNPVMRQKQ